MRCARAFVDDAEVGQAVLALGDDDVIPKEGDVIDFDAGVVRYDIRPLRRRVDRRGNETKILGAFVGANEQPSIVEIGEVLVVLLPRQHHRQRRGRLIGPQIACFGHRFRERRDDDHRPIFRARGENVE